MRDVKPLYSLKTGQSWCADLDAVTAYAPDQVYCVALCCATLLSPKLRKEHW